MAKTTAEQTYRIRALEWRDFLTSGETPGERLSADVPNGYYLAESPERRSRFAGHKSDARWAFYNSGGDLQDAGLADSLPAAKLAAEAHWRATILPALEAV